MASITPYSGGRYRAVVRRKGFKTVSDIFPSKAQAETWARGVETDMDSRRFRDAKTFENDLVSSVFERFIAEVAPSRKGARWEILRLKKMIRETDFMRLQIKNLQPSDIRQWRDRRCKEINPRSVNREMNLLSSAFSHAMEEWDYVFPGGIHPIKAVSRPKNSGPKLRHRRWEQHELEAFLSAAGHDETRRPRVGNEYVSWALLLGLETAMRPSEFCSLKVKDVKLERRYVVLHDSKNGDGRRVPLSSRAVDILTVLVDGKKPDQKIIPIACGSLGTYFRSFRKKAGLADSDLRFYDIKHEAVSRLSEKFSNVLELSAVTGHKSLQSLKYYYNPKVEELVNRLD